MISRGFLQLWSPRSPLSSPCDTGIFCVVAHTGEEPPSKEEQKSLEGDDRERVKKQQHTTRRIYERLIEERGFSGGESLVRNIVS